ncbi:PucR family transcriptional regulator [Nocardioides sambongensis]|uniref:PucR family transcriptional regulator n=1 Tax=Nocardioides sambongensis TaxID=2589074 RepID=UPI0011288786|nr:PucR family transcriptional regulator [Nocardioides sambongensis]
MSWPPPSPQVRRLIRAAAELSLRSAEEWVTEVDAATLANPITALIAADPSLNEAVRRGNYDNMVAWASGNLRAPGEPVAANTSEVQLDIARDMVRRGVFELALDTYRTGQNAAWQRWMTVCFSLTDDAAELEELLAVTAASISTFIDGTIEAVARRMSAERGQLTRGTEAERRDLVTLVLQGSPVAPERAERVLGYGVDGPHLAAVLWTDAGAGDLAELEGVAGSLMRTLGARSRLTVVAAASTLWLWLPVSARTPADLASLEPTASVRIALGTAGDGVDGFRRSHREALEARRFATSVGAADALVTFDDIRLAALVGADQRRSADFVREVLGALADAPAELHETVRVYLANLGNAAATAHQLYAHRNTVVRRLARADALLPRTVAADPVRIGVALEVLRWQGRVPTG